MRLLVCTKGEPGEEGNRGQPGRQGAEGEPGRYIPELDEMIKGSIGIQGDLGQYGRTLYIYRWIIYFIV